MQSKAIRFRNWKTYQGSSAKYFSAKWFRVENTLPDHPIWDELNDAEFRAFVWLLCFTSDKAHRTGTVEVSPKTAGRLSRTSEAAVVSMIEKAIALDIVTVEASEPPPLGDVAEHSPSVRQAIAEQPPSTRGDCAATAQRLRGETAETTVTVTVTDHTHTPPSPAETIPIDDEKIREWLAELRVSARGIEAMIGEYGRDRVLKGLRDAYVGFECDPEGFFEPPLGKRPMSPQSAISTKLRSYVTSARASPQKPKATVKKLLPDNLPEYDD